MQAPELDSFVALVRGRKWTKLGQENVTVAAFNKMIHTQV